MTALMYCHFQCSCGKFQLDYSAGTLKLTVNQRCHSQISPGKVPPNLIHKGMTGNMKHSHRIVTLLYQFDLLSRLHKVCYSSKDPYQLFK